MKIQRMSLMGCVLLFVVGMLAVPAAADVTDNGSVVINGTATVGKNFKVACGNDGKGEPQGKGLVFPSPINTSKAPGKTAVYRLSTVVTMLTLADAGKSGQLNVCGNIGPAVNAAGVQVGAACGASSSTGGQGKLDVIGGRKYRVYNVGWISAVGGTLPITGNIRKIDNLTDKNPLKVEGTIGGVVQAIGGIECTETKCGDPKFCTHPNDGATSFTVLGTVVAGSTNASLNK